MGSGPQTSLCPLLAPPQPSLALPAGPPRSPEGARPVTVPTAGETQAAKAVQEEPPLPPSSYFGHRSPVHHGVPPDQFKVPEEAQGDESEGVPDLQEPRDGLNQAKAALQGGGQVFCPGGRGGGRQL